MKNFRVLRFLMFAGAMMLGVQCAQAQSDKAKEETAKPDFSGTWIRNNARSSGLQGALADAELIVLITHKDPEFKVSRSIKLNEQRMTQDLVYYTDHRGETNPATLGGGDVKSKTKWNKNKIETTASWSRTGRTGEVSNFDSTEKWELSADGKTLMESVDISTPNGLRSIRQLYTRK